MEIRIDKCVRKLFLGISLDEIELADVPAEPDIFVAELADVAAQINGRRFGAELELFKYVEYKIDKIGCACISEAVVQLQASLVGHYNVKEVVRDLYEHPASALAAFLALHSGMYKRMALAVELRIAQIYSADRTHVRRDAIRDVTVAVLDVVAINRFVFAQLDIEFEV